MLVIFTSASSPTYGVATPIRDVSNPILGANPIDDATMLFQDQRPHLLGHRRQDQRSAWLELLLCQLRVTPQQGQTPEIFFSPSHRLRQGLTLVD
jgi:hypothetical protein